MPVDDAELPDPLHDADRSSDPADAGEASSSADDAGGQKAVEGGPADSDDAAPAYAGAEAEAAERNKASGWFLIDADGVVRGWCLDSRVPLERQQVSVVFDGREGASVRADRLFPRLRELDKGDGYSAFAVAVPAAYRDGAEHEVSVKVATPGYEATYLKSKAPTFTLSADATLPTVSLLRAQDGYVEGVVEGPALRQELDLWIGGERVAADDYHVDWISGPAQTLYFRLHPEAHDLADLLAGDALVAYPGVREATGEGAAVAALLRIDVQGVGNDLYQVTVGPGVPLADGQTLFAEILSGQAGERPLANPTLAMHGNAGEFSLANMDKGGQLSLRLKLPSGVPFGPAVPFAVSQLSRRMLRNGALEEWSAAGPDRFQTGEGVAAERGFYAFPAAIKAEHALSGKVLAAELAAGSDETVLLSQELPQSDYFGLEPVDVGLGSFIRASRPVSVTARLTDGTTSVDLNQGVVGLRWKADWRTSRFERPDAAPAPLRFELAVRPLSDEDEPTYVEVAGLHVGEPEIRTFADEPATPEDRRWAAPGENLVVNADLTSWPGGLFQSQRRSRFEFAEGWACFNRRSSAEVTVAAAPAPRGQVGRYALAIGITAVPEYCRIEIALDCLDLFGPGQISLDARCDNLPTPENGTFVPQRWAFLDSIYLLRRSTREQDGRLVSKDTVLTKVARRVVVAREWQSYRFDFNIDQAAGGEFDVAGGDELAEYFAVVEVRQPVALSLYGFSVRLGRRNQPVAASPLQMEDRNIHAQVGVLRGIDEWGAAATIHPAVIAADPGPPSGSLRWSWRYADLGTVDVGICVYNAADETMDCLRSLVGTTTVPHTVRIINDGSDEDTRQRIAAFVADKPWMKLIDNDGNQGYTFSANRAVQESDADWVILLNSDTIVSDGWIEGLLEAAASDPGAAFIGAVSNAATYQSVPELYDGAGKWAVNDLPRGFTPADMASFVAARSNRHFPEVPLLNGFCTLIRRAVFDEVGGLDIQAFPAGYGEEKDLCLRVRKAGYRLRVADHVYVYHSKSASFGTARRTELAKAGDKALRALHQDVDLGALGRDFLQTPALVELRDAVRGAYALTELVPPTTTNEARA